MHAHKIKLQFYNWLLGPEKDLGRNRPPVTKKMPIETCIAKSGFRSVEEFILDLHGELIPP